MIIICYIGIFLLCYGIYNMLSYFSVLPTVIMGRKMKMRGRLFDNAFIIELSLQIVRKWDLDWKGSESVTEIMRYNKIYYSATIYRVSVILTALCGLVLCLPLLFWNRIWFILLSAAVMLYVFSDPLLLVYRYRKKEPEQKKDTPQKKKITEWVKKLVRLLPGVFFLCQILLFVLMLT